MGIDETQRAQRERLLRILSAATFLIFFQAYMIAPLLPALALEFGVSAQAVGMAVPAYLIPYGASTLAYGLLSDRLGRRRLVLGSLLAFVALLALTATARSSTELIAWRFVAGVGASAVVPLALVVVATLYPYEERGRPLGWLFGAMAGGMAFGSTFGAVLQPLIGWRATFLMVAALATVVFVLLLPTRRMLGEVPGESPPPRAMLRGYRELLFSERGRRTYAYVFVNAVFHSGVFTWLGLYFKQRFGLGEMGIGLALLGYGIPGFAFGPGIGKAADRWGRARVLPLGLLLSAAAGAALIGRLPLIVTALLVTLLSLGYDMTQPMLAGIITALGGKRPGQAMGLNVFTLFVGFGVGSLVFGELVRHGYAVALGAFGAVELVAALAAFQLFRAERVAAST